MDEPSTSLALNSKDHPIQRITKAAWYLFVRMLTGCCASALLIVGATAGENEVTRELVRRVGVDDGELWKEAPKLYASIATEQYAVPL